MLKYFNSLAIAINNTCHNSVLINSREQGSAFSMSSLSSQQIRPLSAYKLLTLCLYGRNSFLELEGKGIVQIRSIRDCSRFLGTDTWRVRRWLVYLEELGYIDSLTVSPNKRTARFQLRKPPNV